MIISPIWIVIVAFLPVVVLFYRSSDSIVSWSCSTDTRVLLMPNGRAVLVRGGVCFLYEHGNPFERSESALWAVRLDTGRRYRVMHPTLLLRQTGCLLGPSLLPYDRSGGETISDVLNRFRRIEFA